MEFVVVSIPTTGDDSAYHRFEINYGGRFAARVTLEKKTQTITTERSLLYVGNETPQTKVLDVLCNFYECALRTLADIR